MQQFRLSSTFVLAAVIHGAIAATACTSAKPVAGAGPKRELVATGPTPAPALPSGVTPHKEDPSTQPSASNVPSTSGPSASSTPPTSPVEPADATPINPPPGVTPDDPSPPGVTPNDPPPGVTPNDPPPGVTPNDPPPGVTPNDPPPGVTPNDPPSTGVTPTGFQFPAACLTNQVDSHHVTDNGYIMKLTGANGAVVAAARMSMAAITRGFSCSANSFNACYVLDIPLSFTALSIPDGGAEGHLSLCRAKDLSDAPENAKCEDVLQGQSTSLERRTVQYLDLPVKFSVSGGEIKVTDYEGMPGDPDGENLLIVYHPAFAFAAPGACAKDFLSPLVLDLDRNGTLDLTNAWDEGTNVSFDWRGDGRPTRTGWVAPSDAFLVLGTDVRDGTSLFGEFSRSAANPAAKGKTFGNGFEALRQYDQNGDQRIDAADPVFSELRVWSDANRNGQAEKTELSALPALGIVELEVAYRPETPARRINGNELWFSSSYVTKEKKRYLIGDVWFNQRQHFELTRSTR